MNEIDGRGVEIRLGEEEDFLKVRETLTRIGVASKKEKKLYQSCNLLHKRGRYYIMHFKEMMELDGRTCDITPEDLSRRNMIAKLLQDWGLIKVHDQDCIRSPSPRMSLLKIVPFKDKPLWELVPKYTCGHNKR